ncbi:hypothetical protein [Alteribacillus sp. YIM 98480]|uniref:hypothetical protein n=1 Tax=Alteribacillus sp. YIM 98480 TaxID=2606599 RepID=UPI00131DBF8E|nr:hypothetical protein [Alteribacillus sp. YIM 98480]
MSSASAYSLEIPSVRQWKAKISFPYGAPQGLVACEQGACAFLIQPFIEKGFNDRKERSIIGIRDYE